MSKSVNPMASLLASGSYGILAASLSLTKAYRQLTFQVVNGKSHEFQTRMNLWIDRTYTNITPRKKCSINGNVTRALAKDRLSWGMFMKGIDILGYTKVYIKMVFLKKNSVHTGVYTVNKTYKALLNGEGYSRGEILIYSVTCDFEDNSVVYELWFNRTTNKMITNLSTLNGLRELNDTQEIDILIPDVGIEYSKTDDLSDIEE
jgi:hypothetical protein